MSIGCYGSEFLSYGREPFVQTRCTRRYICLLTGASSVPVTQRGSKLVLRDVVAGLGDAAVLCFGVHVDALRGRGGGEGRAALMRVLFREEVQKWRNGRERTSWSGIAEVWEKERVRKSRRRSWGEDLEVVSTYMLRIFVRTGKLNDERVTNTY